MISTRRPEFAANKAAKFAARKDLPWDGVAEVTNSTLPRPWLLNENSTAVRKERSASTTAEFGFTLLTR